MNSKGVTHFSGVARGAPKDLSTATQTLTAHEHGGNTLTLNRAAGVTVTLPAATGSGARFRLVVITTVTSNGYIVKVANATDVMIGRALLLQDAADTVVGFETAATTDTITLDGSTTGGIAGAVIEVEDVASGKWLVSVTSAATGAEATPFSATVA